MALGLAGCTLGELGSGLSANPPATTQPENSAPQTLDLHTTVHIAGDLQAYDLLAPALAHAGFVIKDDPAAAMLHIVMTSAPSSSPETTSAPLIGILRTTTRTDTYALPFTIQDAIYAPIHQGTVIGFGDEKSGIYPKISKPLGHSASKAKDDAVAQLPEVLLAVLKPRPWRAVIIAQQDSHTVILGADESAGLARGQKFVVVGQPALQLTITGFGAYGRAIASSETGPLPAVGQWIEPASRR